MTSHDSKYKLPLKDSNLNKQYQKLSYYRYTKGQVAEGGGFEPPDQFPDRQFSRLIS